MRAITRKCSICKEPIYINDTNEDFFITLKNETNSYTHTNCYIEKQTTKKRSPKTVEECQEYIEQCRQSTKAIEKKKSTKNELYEFLFDMYDISYFPQYFYIKMDSVYKGTMKNLNKPVPPEDLLDMWKQKRNYLDKVAEQNRKKGNEILGVNRVNYDLAILLSKYDSYLKWKEQQKIAIAELDESKKRSIEKIEYTDVTRPKRVGTTDNKVDINSMLDEI